MPHHAIIRTEQCVQECVDLKQGYYLHTAQVAWRRQAGARAEVAAVQDLAEVRARDDLGRQRALVGKVLQRRAQQADAVRRQRALAELVDDAQRPARCNVMPS